MCKLATLVVFAPIYALVGGILIAVESIMVFVAGIGVVISLTEGKIAQALFRALLLFFAYKGLIIFKDINYLRGRNGARVFFKQTSDGFEILAKANKANEQTVIKILESIYK